jgi:hypothetical protein
MSSASSGAAESALVGQVIQPNGGTREAALDELFHGRPRVADHEATVARVWV